VNSVQWGRPIYRHQVALVTKFCAVTPNIFTSSVWNLFQCHSSNTENFVVAYLFLDNLWILVLKGCVTVPEVNHIIWGEKKNLLHEILRLFCEMRTYYRPPQIDICISIYYYYYYHHHHQCLVFVCVCLFSWRYNPLWLYFHSPVAGFSFLVFEVSWSHTTTRHSR
jgi:hypothetical protein